MKADSIDLNKSSRKLAELIKGIRIAMMTTVDPNGQFHSRPMAAQEMEFDGDLWFFTDKNSAKVFEVQRNQNVQLSYVDSSKGTYVSVNGQGQIVDDKAKSRSLWNPLLKAWFPKGAEDPDLILIKVKVEKAEYWDSPSGKLVQMLGFAKATLTGHSYSPGPEEHNVLDLRHP